MTFRLRQTRLLRLMRALTRRLVRPFSVTLTLRPNGIPQRVPILGGTGSVNRFPGESWMLELLATLVPRYPGAFYDVGANLGQTLLKLHTVATRPEYVAFEPNPYCVNYLEELRAANSWPNGWIVPVAAAEREGLATLHFYSDSRVGSGASVRPKAAPTIHRQTIALSRVSTAIQDLDLPAPGIIKLDVEGAEDKALAGMGTLLADHAPVLIVEILPSGAANPTYDAIRNHLESAGYSLLRIKKTARAGLAGIVPATNAPESHAERDHLAVPTSHVAAVQAALPG